MRSIESVLSIEECMGINEMRYLFEGAIIIAALYAAEEWGMRSAERRKVNVLEMKCL